MSTIEDGTFDAEPEKRGNGEPLIQRIPRFEPPPTELTLQPMTVGTALGGFRIEPPIVPSGLRYDFVINRPKVDEITDEENKATARSFYQHKSIDALTVVPETGQDIPNVSLAAFLLDEPSVHQDAASVANKINPVALANGFVPRIFEFSRIPYQVREIKLHGNDKLVEVRNVDWVKPGYAVEAAEQCVTSFTEKSGFGDSQRKVIDELEKSSNQAHLDLWKGGFPCPELEALPLVRVVEYLDSARIQERGDNLAKSNYRQKSLTLKVKIQSLTEKFEPRLAQKMNEAKTLTALYQLIPVELKAALFSSQVKNLALQRINKAFGHVARAVFLERSKTSLYVSEELPRNYIRRQLGADLSIPDFKDVKTLLELTKLCLTAFPLPDPPVSEDPNNDDSYLSFQALVADESMRMMDLAQAA